MPKISSLPSLLSLAAFALGGAYAGKGAEVNACVQFETLPEPLTIRFIAGSSGDRCMNHRGGNALVQVTRPGLFCGSLGYVELKASSSNGDTCATDRSFWGTGYIANNTVYSGATNSEWSSAGMELKDRSPGTVVCTNELLCESISQGWGGTGKLWIIYRPPTGRTSNQTIIPADDHRVVEENDDTLHLTPEHLRLAMVDQEL